MHDKYWLLALAALMVLALYLQWWPGGRPGHRQTGARVFWLALYVAILAGSVQLFAYGPDAVMGSPQYWLYAGSFFIFWGAVSLAGLVVALAVYVRFVR